jgi:hypothetical protein
MAAGVIRNRLPGEALSKAEPPFGFAPDERNGFPEPRFLASAVKERNPFWPRSPICSMTGSGESWQVEHTNIGGARSSA